MKSGPVLRLLPYITRAIVALGLVVISLVIVTILVRTAPQVQRNPALDEPRREYVLTLRPVTVSRRFEGYGTARAMDTADITAEITAVVEHLPADMRAGRPVAAGDILAILDSRDYRRAVEMAEAQVALIEAQLEALAVNAAGLARQVELAEEEAAVWEAEYERAVDSRGRGGATDLEVDRTRGQWRTAQRLVASLQEQADLIGPRRRQLESTLEAEEARLAVAQRDLERTLLMTPIDGVLQDVMIRTGERLGPGTAVARVVNQRRIEVPVNFPVTAQQWLEAGDEVRLTAENDPELCWTGAISRIAPESPEQTRTALMFVEIEQDAEARPLLMPGQFVRAEVRSASQREALVVPRRALLDRMLLRLVDGRVERIEVSTDYALSATFPSLGVDDREWVVLPETTPLRAGDVVILSNVELLQPGMLVAGVESGAADGAGP